MYRLTEEQSAEDATGCCEHPKGLGAVYAGFINRKGHVTRGDYELKTEEDIRDYLTEGGSVYVPNAGAGSYRKVFVDIFGFKDIEVFEWTSSAGDWTFVVFDGEFWQLAGQTNRYPRAGFDYWVDDLCFMDKEELFKFMERQY